MLAGAANSSFAFWNFLELSGIKKKCFQSAVGWIHRFGTCGFGGLTIYENDDFAWPIMVLIFKKIFTNCLQIFTNISIFIDLNT